MKRTFSSLWFGKTEETVVDEEETKYQQQLREDEEYARKLLEDEEREERKRIAQERADEELARKLSEQFSSPQQQQHPAPQRYGAEPEIPQHEIVEWNPSIRRRNEQIESDELLAISLAFSDFGNDRERGSYNGVGYGNYNEDEKEDDVQYLGTKRPRIEENPERENGADDKRASMLIASVKDELRMPEVDIHRLLCEFNRLIFHGKLDSVSISWSRQMKLCAGVCKYFRGGFCEVRLSEPLLKFRPRDDFLNTLLHEMIHAYCKKYICIHNYINII